MEDNSNELEMGVFGVDTDLELNFGVNPDDIQEDLDTPPADDTAADDINQPNEDEDPEDVVGDDEDQEGGDDAPSPNLYSSFASELHSKGVLPTLDLDKNSIEDTDGLANVIQGEITAQVKEYLISKVGAEGFDALEKGVSLSQYQQHTNTVETLDSITDDSLAQDLDLAKRVILQDYVNQGLSEVRAKRILQKTIDLGEDAVLEDAKNLSLV